MSTEQPLAPEYLVSVPAVSSSGAADIATLPPTFSFKDYKAAAEGTAAAGRLGGLSENKPIQFRTGGFNDTRNDVNADGKYLLLAVPEWKPGMSSYLRLGAACSTWDTALGNELEKVVHLIGPVGKATTLPFIDDERNRGGTDVHPGVGATISESEILHTKGGWRDHSDGNRITTTYGDKIEVIRGGYKMVVMGRNDTPLESAGWDLSGQFVQDWGYSRPGASVTVQWLPIYGDVVKTAGTWLQRDSAEIFHLWSRTAGNKKDEYWGDLRESYIGIEKPAESMAQTPAWPGREMNPSLKVNPVIIKKTFALSMTSEKGSENCPIQTITEETHVTESTSTTTADSATETTVVTGAITETKTTGSSEATVTVAGDSTDTKTVGGSISESSVIGGSTTGTTTVSGAITEVTTAAEISESATSDEQTSITVAGIATDVTIAALRTDTFTGEVDTSLHASALKIDVSAGFVVELDLTAKGTFSFGVEDSQAWAVSQEMALIDATFAVGYFVDSGTVDVAALFSYIGVFVFIGIAPG